MTPYVLVQPLLEGSGAADAAASPGAPARVVLVTLNHPAKRNALSLAMCEELSAALTRAAAAGARAAVLTGAGEAFCAGYDLNALPEEPDAQWLREHGPLGAMMRAVSEGPLPVVAALNGATVGAGCELALACDLRVAHPGTRLQMPPVNLGLIYTPEGVGRLIALCGLGRARQLLLTGEPVLADEAHGWGLVHRVVPAAQVLPAAHQLAQTLAEKPQLALRGTRVLIERLLREGPLLTAGSAEEIFALREQAFNSADARAARAAFRARLRRG